MKIRIRNIVISIIIFGIGMGADCFLTGILRQREISTLQTRAQLHAQIYGNALNNQFIRAKDTTRTVQYAVISGDGKITDFDHIARKWKKDNQYIEYIQLAPMGVVTQSYPKTEVEESNLLKDPQSTSICQYAMKHDTVTIQGPYKLKQGGYGYAIRNPVFFFKNGKKVFWGFASVIIDADRLLNHYSDTLTALHYKFNLYQKNIGNSDYKIIGGEKQRLKGAKAYSFTFAHSAWKFSIIPESGYRTSIGLKMIFALFFSVILLLSYLVYIMLMKQEQQKLDRKRAVTDYLTGLLNRNGFDDSVKTYLKTHKNEEGTMIMLDIDDFKFVNDLHGHKAGDLVLKHMADQLRHEFGRDAIIGRNGGDEFCIYIKHTDRNSIPTRLTQFASHLFRIYDEGVEVHFTISIGYAFYPLQAHDFKNLILCADASLYFMKLNQKKGAAMYQEGMLEIRRERLGFNLKDIALHLPVAFMIYSLKEGGRILFANHEMITKMGCKTDEEFFAYMHHSAFSVIEDYDQLVKDLKAQLYDPQNNKEAKLSFYAKSKEGKRLYFHERARLVNNDFFGDIIYATLIIKEVS